MMHGRTWQVLRIVDSAVVALQSWQILRRSSGPDVPIHLTLSAISSASLVGGSLAPPALLVSRGPERLDIRTRLGFFLAGMGTLGCVGSTMRALVLHQSQDRQRAWNRRMARQSLWKRLTAIAPPDRRVTHGRPFTFVAAALALFMGGAQYRSPGRGDVCSHLSSTILSGIGRIFPGLPMFGLARQPAMLSPRLRRIFILVSLSGSVFGVRSLRIAFISQAEYEERRRREQRMEGAS